MTGMRRFHLIVAMGLVIVSMAVSASEPVTVLLPVGQERRLEIAGAQAVRVGVPRDLSQQLQVESAGPYVWLKALKVLPQKRLHLETQEGLHIVEIRTDPHAPATPVRLPVTHPTAISQNREDVAIGYVALARHAVQALYVPSEHQIRTSGIRQIAVERQPVALFRCRKAAPAACGDATEAQLHAAWQTSTLHATAVTVRNRLSEPLILDPRDIRGRFAAAVIVHPRLEATGSPRDTTTVVLISRAPFARGLP